VDDQRRHVAVGHPPGEVGVHDFLSQEDLSSAGGVDGTAAGDDTQLDAADVDPVGDQPQRDHQPSRLLGSWPTAGAQDTDGETLVDAHGEKYQDGRAEDSDAHFERRGKGGDEDEPKQTGDDQVRQGGRGLDQGCLDVSPRRSAGRLLGGHCPLQLFLAK